MRKIILASTSPRRKELLEKYNLNPIVVKSCAEEKLRPDEGPEQIVMSLAFEKVNSISHIYANDIIIGADTIVVYENKILGKPKDEDDAYRILKTLSGKEHEVLTGICIINPEKNIKVVDYERTIVKFRKLDDEKIRDYIKTGEPLDKAGAYGIQGYGAILVDGIQGCYTNVVGLPLPKLDFLLGSFFGVKIL